jgi:hypothetical protein
MATENCLTATRNVAKLCSQVANRHDDRSFQPDEANEGQVDRHAPDTPRRDLAMG